MATFSPIADLGYLYIQSLTEGLCADGKNKPKLRYRSLEAAKQALALAQQRGKTQPRRQEKRIYWHSYCRGYHLTSHD